MGWRVVAVAAVGLLMAADKVEDKAASDRTTLQGTWALVSMQSRETGQFVDVDEEAVYYELRFDGVAVGICDGGTRTSGCVLDTKNRRLSWDGGYVAYELKGDTLTVRQPAASRDSVLPGFTSFANSLTLIYERETPDNPPVAALDKECRRLEGTWQPIYRLREPDAKERDAEEAGRRPAFRPTSLSRSVDEVIRYGPSPLQLIFKGRKVLLREEGEEGGEEVDLWVNPRSTPKRITIAGVGSAIADGTYELKGDVLRIRCAAGNTTDFDAVDVMLLKRKK